MAEQPYAATLPWFSEKCVRSLGALPAPEIPDLASTMTSPGSRPARSAAAGTASPRSDSSRDRRRAGAGTASRVELRQAVDRAVGQRRRRRIAPRLRLSASSKRKAPDRSMTRTPARQRRRHFAAKASGRARKTTSAPARRRCRAVISPSQMRARPGRARLVDWLDRHGGLEIGAWDAGPAGARAPVRHSRWRRPLRPDALLLSSVSEYLCSRTPSMRGSIVCKRNEESS